MQRYYSPATGGFYSEAVHGARQIAEPQTAREIKAGKRPAMIDNPACTIPADAVQISGERYAELLAAQADPAQGDGREIVAIGGKPMARDRQPDPAERSAVRRRKRDRLLAESDRFMLPDSRPPGGEKAWRDYRAALFDLDMTGSDWPPVPGAVST